MPNKTITTKAKYRIIKQGTVFQAQVRKLFGWKNIGDLRTNIERACAEINLHRSGDVIVPTEQEISSADPRMFL